MGQGAWFTGTGDRRSLTAHQSPDLLDCPGQVIVDYHRLPVDLGQAQNSVLESNQAFQLGIGESAAGMVRAKNS